MRPTNERAGTDDPLAPARGLIVGLILSGFFWCGVIGVVLLIAKG